ncbi:MAG: phenylalanine--tRNA ligase subunit alpha [Nitrospirota bacterium]
MSESIGQIISGLHPLERKVLAVFAQQPAAWDHELLQRTGLDESRLAMALGWLQSKGVIGVEEERGSRLVSLTELGRNYARVEIPERRIMKELTAGRPILIQELRERLGLEQLEVSTAVGNLKQHGIARVGQGGALELVSGELPPQVVGLTELISRLNQAAAPVADEIIDVEDRHILYDYIDKHWKTRGIFKFYEKVTKRHKLTALGVDLVARLPEEASGDVIGQLTPEMLKDGTWKGKAFRKYHIELNPPRIAMGSAHPYRQFLHDVQIKLISMGFEEMQGPLVESEFWNMDALYMPQFHPARDIHDVYFPKDLAPADDIDPALLERVAVTHERGGASGSAGWRYTFDRARARQPILRSQGTAVSARTLAGKPRVPGKYFSIARCFRYDQVDATHAPDFFQIEGVVLDRATTFRALLGLLKLFAAELAKADEIKFLPAYFPFTEPSVELHARHPRLGWIELGGAGLFRPEVTMPMGVEVPVIAWGLGLDRMAMVAMGLHDIRDLFSTDLEFLRTLRPPSALSSEPGT